jgi:hypothetical protein
MGRDGLARHPGTELEVSFSSRPDEELVMGRAGQNTVCFLLVTHVGVSDEWVPCLFPSRHGRMI